MEKTPIAKTLHIDPTKLNAYSTGLLQGKAYRTLNIHLTKLLMQYDLSIPEWKLLGQVHDHGNMRLADLAERLSVEAPLVTSLIDQLEKKHLVVRRADEYDKRAKVISGTNQGMELLQEIEPKVKMVMGKLLWGVTRAELVTYIKVLEAIVNNG